MKLEQAREIAEGLVMALRPVCTRAAIAGSVRRGKPEVKDIELVVIPNKLQAVFGDNMLSPLDRKLNEMVNAGALQRGDKNGQRMKTFIVPTLEGGIKLDLFIVLPPALWGVIYTLRTGPDDFSHWLVTWRAAGGACPNTLHVRDGCLRDLQSEAVIATPEEADFFTALGLEWIEPGERKARWWSMRW